MLDLMMFSYFWIHPELFHIWCVLSQCNTNFIFSKLINKAVYYVSIIMCSALNGSLRVSVTAL